MFLLENMSMILENPDHFLQLALASDDLRDWYPSSRVGKRRQDIASVLKIFSTIQRSPGGFHENLGKLVVPNLVQEVKRPEASFSSSFVDLPMRKKDVMARQKKRTCGLCKELGHNRRR